MIKRIILFILIFIIFSNCKNVKSANLLDLEKKYSLKIYKSEKANFSFKFPSEIVVNDFSKKIEDDYTMLLNVYITHFDDMPEISNPVDLSKEDARYDSDLISKGKNGTIPFMAQNYKVEKFKNIYMASYYSLTMHSVEDIFFEKVMIFYHNDYQMKFYLFADENEVFKGFPNYFQKSGYEGNMWKIDKEELEKFFERFINDIENVKDNKNITLWNDGFDIIKQSLEVY